MLQEELVFSVNNDGIQRQFQAKWNFAQPKVVKSSRSSSKKCTRSALRFREKKGDLVNKMQSELEGLGFMGVIAIVEEHIFHLFFFFYH